MDSEQIKEQVSMQDVLAMYGIRANRAGFICCPFHKERTASLKVYKDSFYCFGCGASGDIFGFVQQMDGISFKDAFVLLGGTYPDGKKQSDFARKMALYHLKKKKETDAKKRLELDRKRHQNGNLIDLYRDGMRVSDPLSDEWCAAYNQYQLQLYDQCVLNNLEERW